MITTLTGSNTFLLRDKLSALVTAYTQVHGNHELERLDGEQVSLDQIKGALESLPFLAEQKCLVLYNPQAVAGFADAHESLLADIVDSVQVIIVEPAIDKRTKYARYLQKQTQYHEFNELAGPDLLAWIVETAKQAGATIDRPTAQQLIDRVGTEQYTLYNELHKLAAYDETITEATIQLLSQQTPQSTVFQLIDAIFSGQVETALGLYDDQRAQKIEPQKILYMIVRQVYIIGVVSAAPATYKDNDIAQETKFHPFVVQKARQAARRLSKPMLTRCVAELRDIDRTQKTTTVQLDEQLRSFIVTVSHLQQD